VYTQGDPAHTVLYLQRGAVKISVVSPIGKEAVVAILGAGDFFGESCLVGQAARTATATTTTVTRVSEIDRDTMRRALRTPPLSHVFLGYVLTKQTRIEDDLIDQLFHTSEQRLARALLLLARYGDARSPETIIPRISQEVLAERIGTTRARVNFFMNKFRRLGYIENDAASRRTLTVRHTLLNVMLHG
jgi:CRP/FNR family cyclic AMP-dependent transcriptional regulator